MIPSYRSGLPLETFKTPIDILAIIAMIHIMHINKGYKMKFSLASVLVVSALLAACNSSSNSSTAPTNTTPAKPPAERVSTQFLNAFLNNDRAAAQGTYAPGSSIDKDWDALYSRHKAMKVTPGAFIGCYPGDPNGSSDMSAPFCKFELIVDGKPALHEIILLNRDEANPKVVRAGYSRLSN